MNEMAPLDEFLQTPEFFRDPYPIYRRMRTDAPVLWSSVEKQWLVSRMADAKEVLRDTVRFSSFGWENRYLSTLPPATRNDIPSINAHVASPHLLISDGSLHDRLRQRFRPPFVPRAIEDTRLEINSIVAELMDEAADQEPVDVVATLAYPLPARVIASMYGAPPQDRELLQEWSSRLTGFFSRPVADPKEALEVDPHVGDFRAYLTDLIEDRQKAPKQDLATMLAADDWDEEMVAARLGTAVLLMVAGHTTTTNLIANCINAMLRNPGQLDIARSSPGLFSGAIDETLRWDAPVQRIRRVATQDTLIGDKQIRQGDRISVLAGAANRDETLCDRPEEFDISRAPLLHLAFGSGMHFCLGNSLARLEATIAVSAFFERFPAARLEPNWQPEWRPSLTARSLANLPVWTQPAGDKV